MFCKQCGKEIDDDAKFRPSCGASLTRQETDALADKAASDAADTNEATTEMEAVSVARETAETAASEAEAAAEIAEATDAVLAQGDAVSNETSEDDATEDAATATSSGAAEMSSAAASDDNSASNATAQTQENAQSITIEDSVDTAQQNTDATGIKKGDFIVLVAPDGSGLIITAYNWSFYMLASITSINIPSRIGGVPVVRIADGAFKDCTDLVSVKIPRTVTSIGKGAFDGCPNLSLKSQVAVKAVQNRGNISTEVATKLLRKKKMDKDRCHSGSICGCRHYGMGRVAQV